METVLKEKLETLGVDWETTIRRFLGNEEMYQKFLKKFSRDTNYALLKQAIEAGRYSEVERLAHTLKGVSANLGLEIMQDILQRIVNAVRIGETSRIPDDFDLLTDQYNQFQMIAREL